MAKRVTDKPPPPERRSPCPVACALDIFGDRWTLLVIRDLVLGKTRFKDFAASPEGIPTNVLSERLSRLLEHKIVSQVSASEGSKHLAYRLTEKGRALLPIALSAGCTTPSPRIDPLPVVLDQVVLPLVPEAALPKRPPICEPTCSAGSQKLFEELATLLKPGTPASSPAAGSPATGRW